MFFVFEILPQICKSESEFLLDIWRSRYSFRMTKHPFNNFEGRIIGISGVCSVAEILSDALLMLTACIQINLSSVVYWVGPFHSPSILRCNVQFYYSVCLFFHQECASHQPGCTSVCLSCGFISEAKMATSTASHCPQEPKAPLSPAFPRSYKQKSGWFAAPNGPSYLAWSLSVLFFTENWEQITISH